MASAGRVRAGQAFVELILDTKDVQYGLKRLQSNFKSYQKIFEEYSVITISFAVGSLAPIRKAVSEFGEFDKKMRLVNAITNATQYELESMSKTVRHLGRTTLFSAQQVSDAMVILARAGFSSREAERSAKDFLNLSLSTASDLEKSIEIASATMRGFGTTVENVSEVVDILSTAANASAQSLEELGHGFKFIVPIAKSAGLSLKETAQMSAYLANMGLKGSNAATNLRNILLRMPRMKEQYKELLGVDVLDNVGNLRSVVDVLRDVKEASEDLPSGKRLTIFNDLFGRYGVSGASAFVAGTDMSNVFDIIDKAAGESGRVADRVSASISGAFAIMTGNVKDSFIELGDALQPVLFDLSSEVSMMAVDFSSFIRDNQDSINDFVRILAEMFRDIVRLVAMIGKFGTNHPGLSKMVLYFATLAPQIYAASKAFTVLKTAFTGLKAFKQGAENKFFEIYRDYYTRVKDYEQKYRESQQPAYDLIEKEREEFQKEVLNQQDVVDQMEQEAKNAVKERADAENLFTKATENAKEIQTEAFEYDTAIQEQADYLRETEKNLKEELKLRKRYLELQKNVANEDLRQNFPDIVARNEAELEALKPTVSGLKGINEPISSQEVQIKDIQLELNTLKRTIEYAEDIINKDVGDIDVSKYKTTFEKFSTGELKQREAALKNEIELRERWLAYTNEIAEKERISSEVANEYKKSKAKSFKKDITTIKNLEGTDLGAVEQKDFIEKRKKELAGLSQKIVDIEKDAAVQFDSIYLEDYNKAVQDVSDAYKELKTATDAYNESPKSEQKHYRDTLILNAKIEAYEEAIKKLELLEQSFGKNLPINEQDYLEGVRLARDEEKKLSNKHLSVGTALKEKEKEYKSIQTQIENAVGGTSDVSTPELATMSKDLNLLWSDYMAASSSVDSFKKSLKELKKEGVEKSVIEASERELLNLESIAADHKTTYENALKDFFAAKKKESDKTIQSLEASLKQAEQKILDVRTKIGPTDARDALDAFMKKGKYKSLDDIKAKTDKAKREYLDFDSELNEAKKKFSELFNPDGTLIDGKKRDRYNLQRKVDSLTKKRQGSFDKWLQLSLDKKEYGGLAYDFQKELGDKVAYNPTEILDKMLDNYTKQDTEEAYREGKKSGPKRWTVDKLWSEYKRLRTAKEGAEERVKDKQIQLGTTYKKDQDGNLVETEGPEEAKKRRSYTSQLNAALKHQEKINAEFEKTSDRLRETGEIFNEAMPFERANREFDELAEKLREAKEEGSLIDIDKLEKSHEELVELRKEYSLIKEELNEASKSVAQAEAEYQKIQNKTHLGRDKGDLARAEKDLEAAKSNYDKANKRANDAEAKLNSAKQDLTNAINARDTKEKDLKEDAEAYDLKREEKVSGRTKLLKRIYGSIYASAAALLVGAISRVIYKTLNSVAISAQNTQKNADAKRAEAQRVASERELYEKKFEQLRDFNAKSNSKKTTEDIANAQSIIMTLNSRFEGLNLTMDESTKQVKNLEKGFQAVSDAIREKEIQKLEASVNAGEVAQTSGQKDLEKKAYELAARAAGAGKFLGAWTFPISALKGEIKEEYELLEKDFGPMSRTEDTEGLLRKTARKHVAERLAKKLLETGSLTGALGVEQLSGDDLNKVSEQNTAFTDKRAEMKTLEARIADEKERLEALKASLRMEESGKPQNLLVLAQTALEEWTKSFRSDFGLSEFKGAHPSFDVSELARMQSTALQSKYVDFDMESEEGWAMQVVLNVLDSMQGAKSDSNLVKELESSFRSQIPYYSKNEDKWNKSVVAAGELDTIRSVYQTVEDLKDFFRGDKELQESLSEQELGTSEALRKFIEEKLNAYDTGDKTKLPDSEKEYTEIRNKNIRQSIEALKKEFDETNEVLAVYRDSLAKAQRSHAIYSEWDIKGRPVGEGKPNVNFDYIDKEKNQGIIEVLRATVEAGSAMQTERLDKLNSLTDEISTLQRAQVSRLTSIGTFSGREARDLAYTVSWERKQAENLDKLVALATISKDDNRQGFKQVVNALQSDNEYI